MQPFAFDLLVVQTLAGALLAVLVALLVFRVWRGAGTGLAPFAALWPSVRVALWGLLAALCLLIALWVCLAAGFSLPSAPLLAACPASCLWGLAVVAKRLGKGKFPTTLAETVWRSPQAGVTVAGFLRFLSPKLSGHLAYKLGFDLEGSAGGSGPSRAPAPSSLGLNRWRIDGFRWDINLKLHVVAFVSLLLSVQGLLLHFLRALPWKFHPGGRVSLAFGRSLIPVALVLEVLFLYAGLPHTKFTLRGCGLLTLDVHLGKLLAVARLGKGSHLEWPSGSSRALGEFLQSGEAALQGRVDKRFFRPLGPGVTLAALNKARRRNQEVSTRGPLGGREAGRLRAAGRLGRPPLPGPGAASALVRGGPLGFYPVSLSWWLAI
jgi:hypothetical protein